jgi:hypothetical protein
VALAQKPELGAILIGMAFDIAAWALPAADDHPLLRVVLLVLGTLIFVGGIVFLLRASVPTGKPPLFNPEDSPGWELEENEFDVDGPIAGGRNNEGWTWRRNKFRRGPR